LAVRNQGGAVGSETAGEKTSWFGDFQASQFFARGGLQEAKNTDLEFGGQGKGGAIGGEGARALFSFEDGPGFPGADFPEAAFAAGKGDGRQPAAIRTKKRLASYGLNHRLDAFACGRLPHSHAANNVAAGDHPAAVRTHRDMAYIWLPGLEDNKPRFVLVPNQSSLVPARQRNHLGVFADCRI